MILWTLVLMIVPIDFSFAQDYEAVIERLKQAVDAKEISPEQAKAMIAVLKKSSTAKSPQAKPGASAKTAPKKDVSKAKPDWDAIIKTIESAVKAGKLTREQADAKYDELKKQADSKPAVKKAPAKPEAAEPTKPAKQKQP